VIWSVRLLALLVAASWIAGRFDPTGWFDDRRRANLVRFLGELRPWPLREGSEGGTLGSWLAGLWRDGGADAVTSTLAISVAAIVLAGLAGALLSLPAARNFANPRPFLPGGRPAGRLSVAAWNAVVGLTRALLVFLRALPEYVWAFLLLGLLGPTAWPLVLALAIHNTGILGKLTAEVVENTDTAAPSALRGVGATRAQVVLGAILPASLPRFLLYFFYRWETCVREATVLGMLGMASLGYMIMEARAGNRYDEMLFFVLLGVGLVLLGDLVSALVRRAVRRA
jgi:phosphonate transport system permease protein